MAVTFLLRMLTRKRGRAMDPLHVSMTGVRMGERFLQIGCHDRALLAGLAAKVGLSGTAAVAVFDAAEARRAADIGTRVGALIEARTIGDPGAIPFDADAFDMIVVDDTGGRLASLDAAARAACLRDARRVVRQGGRVEIVEGGSRPQGYDMLRELEGAGFKPVRVLAEREGFRFVEGLRPAVTGA